MVGGPIPESEYLGRIRKCQDWMQKEGFEAVLAYSARRWSMMGGTESGGNARYYVGFDFPHKEMVEEGRYVPYMKHDSIVFIPREGEPAFVTKTKHEAEQIGEQSWMSDVRPIYKRFQQDHGRAFQAFTERVEDLLIDRGLNLKGRIGVGGINTPMEIWMELNTRFPEASIHNVTGDLHRLRMVKSKNELKLMRAAAKINDAALYTMIDVCRPGVTEWEVHQAMEATMFRQGADNVWNIVHSGPRSWTLALPDFTQRTLKEGDMISVDYGCEYGGYHSDTNYAMIIGKGSQVQREIIELVVRVMEAILSTTREGVSDTDIVLTAIQSAKNSPLEKYLFSHFGHAYGCGGESYYPSLDAEVQPYKTKEQQIEIKADMVFCYEPQVLKPNLGGACLEDEIIVTENGYEMLTHNTHEAKNALR